MKLPFSYKAGSMFAPLLGVSIAAHIGGFILTGGFFAAQPQFAVDSGLGSVEVVILKDEMDPVKDQKIADEIITVKDAPSATETDSVPEPIKKEEPKKVIEKDVYIPEVKGALTENDVEYLRNPAPRYPAVARQKGWEGVVLLEVQVTSGGMPETVSVVASSGYVVLDDSAKKAVQKWQFKPAHAGAFAFASRIRIPVRFLLEKK